MSATVEGAQQLQMLIFTLAFFHVFSSLITFSLGEAKMRRWEAWEAETRTMEYQFSNDPRRFQFIHQTSFGKRHLRSWSEHRIFRLPVVFFRQFFESVSKVDYLTLRHGFIMAHGKQESNFDFQKYIRRTLEKDFGVVIGMSLGIWIFSVLFIFFNAYVFHNYIWLPFIPVLMLLAVGTKLQSIITKMCLDRNDKSHVVRGSLVVQPSDHFFWFSQPKLLLHLMHFILFQNSFQLAFFSWTWYKFGLRSCFHRKTEDIVIKLTIGILVQILCGYVTLPLYALVTQMGTSALENVFPEVVVKGLRRWQRKAKKNIARKNVYWADASVDHSLTSLSFSTLDASVTAELGITAEEDELYPSTEIAEEGSDATRQVNRSESFEGFGLRNIAVE
ncbi:OLC1v1021427C2 [Oldenlandia corymbosa var. corymbosa]|uniref:OLC1v1021427C2 n=1 Tax=Oldenlandia corymbosa var. corymbosa TaxID=529605 RepID=A0AAV1BVM4_OLDCO|nr:OLC1v1021427C2 [Oldenlandia corymbosa var. corymbosa]